MADVASILETSGTHIVSRIGFAFMFIGVAMKMALLPLHQWLPDAYTDAPATSTALIAPIGAKVAVYIVIRLLHDVFPFGLIEDQLRIFEVLLVTGALAIIWGSVMAIPSRILNGCWPTAAWRKSGTLPWASGWPRRWALSARSSTSSIMPS
jgi:multicomponent Na+:H+ antiporter subunit D